MNPKEIGMKRLACLAVLAAGVCFGLGPAISPAEAATFSLNLSAPQTASVGQPVVIQASGTAAPPSEWWNPSWISAVVLDASVLYTCPASGLDASAIAPSAGGRILGIALPPSVDQAGHFSNVLGFTPGAPGTALLCAYTDDGSGATLARAALSVTVQAAATPAPVAAPVPAPAAKPANVSKPRVKRSRGTLVCGPGRWSNTGAGYAYGWLVGGKPLSGASGRTLKVTRATRGHRVRCSVTATNAAGAVTAVSPSVRVR
jgi:hypothetical protein